MLFRSLDWQAEPILLPFARLQAILNACPNADEVTITPGGTSCTVTIGGGTWTLPTEDAAEYPTWEPSDLRPICRLPADQFVRAVRAVSYATDNESSRYALGAVLVEMKDGVVTLVGTDGRRLATYEIDVDQATDNFVVDPKTQTEKKAPLVPAKALDSMASLAWNSEWSVQLEANTTEVVASIEGTTVTARLVEGRFPPWRDVFPDRDAQPSAVTVPEFLAATRQAAIVTSEQSKGVTFVITSEGIHLTAQSAEAGQSSVTCPLVDFGQAATVKLDPGFVVDLLRSVDDAEPITIEAAGPGDAVIFRAEGIQAVIMPLAND